MSAASAVAYWEAGDGAVRRISPLIDSPSSGVQVRVSVLWAPGTSPTTRPSNPVVSAWFAAVRVKSAVECADTVKVSFPPVRAPKWT